MLQIIERAKKEHGAKGYHEEELCFGVILFSLQWWHDLWVQHTGHFYKGGDCIEMVYTELICSLYQNVSRIDAEQAQACNQMHLN